MDPAEVNRLIEESLAALHDQEPLRALSLADQAAEAAGEIATVRAVRALALLASGSTVAGFDEARVAAELDGENAGFQLLLARAAVAAGRMTLAQESYERALALEPGDGEIGAEFAWFLAAHRGPKLALAAAQRAVADDDRSPLAWTALGTAEFRLRRFAAARTSLARALKLDPNFVRAQSMMALLLDERGRTREAVALARLLEDQPEAQELVETIREHATHRELAGRLAERGIYEGRGAGAGEYVARYQGAVLLVGLLLWLLFTAVRFDFGLGSVLVSIGLIALLVRWWLAE